LNLPTAPHCGFFIDIYPSVALHKG